MCSQVMCSVFDGFGRKRHWWKNLLSIMHSSNVLSWWVSVISSAIKEEDGESDLYKLNNIGAVLFNRRHLLFRFLRNTWKKWFDSIFLSWLEILAQVLKTSTQDRSTNTTPVFRRRWKPISLCVVSAITCLAQLRCLRYTAWWTGIASSIIGWMRWIISL
jgi:hypothetical protein